MTDERQRRMLASYRAAIEPNSYDRDRVRRAIAIAEGGEAPLRRAVVIAVLAAAATIVLAIAWSTLGGTAVHGRATSPKLEAPHGSEARPQHALDEASTIPATLPSRAATPTSAAEEVPRRAAPLREPAATPLPPSESDLLERTVDALDRGAFDDVLRLAAEHHTKFPSGTLAPEARALRILALCKLGRHREGRGEATLFLRERLGTPYDDRIARTCALPQ